MLIDGTLRNININLLHKMFYFLVYFFWKDTKEKNTQYTQLGSEKVQY